MPGVQNGLQPWQAAKASWRRVERAAAGHPHVAICRPSAMTASTVHDLTGVSSSQITQAPQLDVLQPQCEPVSREFVAEEVNEQQPRLTTPV